MHENFTSIENFHFRAQKIQSMEKRPRRDDGETLRRQFLRTCLDDLYQAKAGDQKLSWLSRLDPSLANTLYKKFPLRNPDHPEHAAHLIKAAVYAMCFDRDPRVREASLHRITSSVKTITKTLLIGPLMLLWELTQAVLGLDSVDAARMAAVHLLSTMHAKANYRDEIDRVPAPDRLYWLLCDLAINELDWRVRHAVSSFKFFYACRRCKRFKLLKKFPRVQPCLHASGILCPCLLLPLRHAPSPPLVSLSTPLKISLRMFV